MRGENESVGRERDGKRRDDLALFLFVCFPSRDALSYAVVFSFLTFRGRDVYVRESARKETDIAVSCLLLFFSFVLLRLSFVSRTCNQPIPHDEYGRNVM